MNVTSFVEIRFARPEESEIISRILAEAFAEFKADYTPEALIAVTPPPDEIVKRFDEGPQWVAEKDGQAVGTVSVVPEPEHLYIRSMAVLPTAQGAGIGHKLLDAVEKYGIENGFDKLFLYTTYFSLDAIKLYERHGFQHSGDTTAEEWFGTPGLSMDKKIGRIGKDVIRS